jgi:hypothetical protein
MRYALGVNPIVVILGLLPAVTVLYEGLRPRYRDVFS